jgi:FkbM family methyltransferase
MKRILKRLYYWIPFKRPIFSLVKKWFHPSQSIYKHLHFKGLITINLTHDRFIKMFHYGFQLENDLFWKGYGLGWEGASLKIWAKLARKSLVILDIGSNTGVYSLAAKAINPEARVFAFEPVDRVFDKLVYNIQVNNFDIRPLKYALSNYDGTAKIYDTNSEHTYSVTVNKNLFPENKNMVEGKIRTKKLSTFIKEHMLDSIDLIKIDTETHEPEVIEGMEEFLKQYRPSLLVEVLSTEIGYKIEKMVQGLDYQYYYLDDNLGAKLIDHLTREVSYNYLICSKKVAQEIGL